MKTPKILVVDDDARLSSLVCIYLKQAGYETLQENRPFAAIQSARDFLPDLILLDVDMPGKSGGEIAAELAGDAELENIPVIFVTSLLPHCENSEGDTVRGGRRYLSKPVKRETLLQVVGGLFNFIAA